MRVRRGDRVHAGCANQQRADKLRGILRTIGICARAERVLRRAFDNMLRLFGGGGNRERAAQALAPGYQV